MLHKDIHFLKQISSRLRNFKQIDTVKYRCSCPMCGDSKKDSSKARGGFLRADNSLFYNCFNCGYRNLFSKFLEDFDKDIYNQYKNDNDSPKPFSEDLLTIKKKKVEYFTDADKYLIFNNILKPVTHSKEALEYCKSRILPDNKLNRLYYVEDINDLTKLSFYYRDKQFYRQSFIVMPVYDTNHVISGLCCRNLNRDSDFRYINLAYDNYSDKLFGYGPDEIDFNKPIYCFEGAFDSLFIDNSIAINSASLFKVKNILPDLDIIYVFDNQYDEPNVVGQMEKTIKYGCKIVIWTVDIPYKDVNEMIQNGISNVKEIIDNNIFQNEGAMYRLKKRMLHESNRVI